MSLNTALEIDIVTATTSKIDTVDFDNLTFGNTFTDHMLICDYKEGTWQKPIIKPYEPFMIDPSAKVFHYGQAIFEGMKAYKDENDDVWLFRPDENFHRLNKSALRLAMPEITETIFIDGLKTILNIERNWVKKGLGNTLYIRPFMIAIGSG
ncbi:MAG: branched chain amino acid aminotransferase, partial [Flavobacterium sp.]